MCTNGMLLDSKARKTIIEKNITHVILSFDGVKKETLERIRVGANYEKILSNIMALRDLKIKYKRKFPLLLMDFVMMNSNIHEAPVFVELCVKLGIEMIDFRHMVGNDFYSDYQKEKYNYYRQKILQSSKNLNMAVRLPEIFADVQGKYSEITKEPDLTDYNKVKPDVQTEEINQLPEIVFHEIKENDIEYLSSVSCLRPYTEIMIVEQQKVFPCSYYGDLMGNLDNNEDMSGIFFNEKFQNVRRKKLFSRFDFNCVNCPIKLNLLPTEITL
jgi:MoaA/NifB/PqqE/SkfB family radical SAM enzyme